MAFGQQMLPACCYLALVALQMDAI
ncbi:hypothetical protein CCACVL1_29229 [Corchorus capsularis]|uniref:Uncharacterized protein n=1 Tax=Corchorus capsularis TaxID=210143 RepID=A0A1R3G2W7_COCAP|nr:hypothetical protein CCACVL1_29229 [Corchorus capsularis]